MPGSPGSCGMCHPQQMGAGPVAEPGVGGAGGASGSGPQGASAPPSPRQQSTSATPRSEILSVPPVVSSRLPGLMSLCTMPWLCKYSRPSTSWQKYLRGHGGHLGSPSRTKDRRSQLGSCWGQANRSNRTGGPSGNQGPRVRMSCFWALWPQFVSPNQAALPHIPHQLKKCEILLIPHRIALTWTWPCSHPGAFPEARDPGSPHWAPLHSHHRSTGPAAMGGGGEDSRGVQPAIGGSTGYCEGLPKDQEILKPQEQSQGGRWLCREWGASWGYHKPAPPSSEEALKHM